MIVVQLTGGLGNQLFQYAFARHLAQLNSSELMLDTTQVTSRSDPAHRRQFKLHHFQVEAREVPWDVPSGRFFKGKSGVYSRSKFPWFRRILGKKHYLTQLNEAHFHYDPSALTQRGDFYVTSYWQSHRYFEPVASVIRSDLCLRDPLSEQHRAIKELIDDCPGSVAFIVRRGDFANHPHHSKFHGCCPPDYYARAVDLIKSRVADPHLFIFSDDISWVRQNLCFDLPVTFMDQPYDHASFDYVDLHFISSCNHHIIANSTFGWWGAWLASAADGVVIAPQRWFLDASINTADLIPSHWQRL